VTAVDEAKTEIASDLIDAGGIVSVQVVNEFVNANRRKLGAD
jgi:predicted nucleic acid-binding protein